MGGGSSEVRELARRLVSLAGRVVRLAELLDALEKRVAKLEAVGKESPKVTRRRVAASKKGGKK